MANSTNETAAQQGIQADGLRPPLNLSVGLLKHMDNETDPLPLSPALRPLFNVAGLLLIGLGLAGFWAIFKQKFSAESLVLLGGSMGCVGLGAGLLRAGITGRKFGVWSWWLP